MGRVLLLLLFYLPMQAIAGEPKHPSNSTFYFGINEFNQALSYSGNVKSLSVLNHTIAEHLNYLEKKKEKYKNEAKFVSYSFYYIHKKLLKKYEQYASVTETIEKGTYDCVTATSLYALFFSELNIPFAVVETNYHMYMLVYPKTSNEILLEATDPLYGFITDASEIEIRKKQYVTGNQEQQAYQVNFNWDIENTLKNNELTGIILYNQSIKLFNVGKTNEALQLAEEALRYYNSQRIHTYISFLKGNRLALN